MTNKNKANLEIKERVLEKMYGKFEPRKDNLIIDSNNIVYDIEIAIKAIDLTIQEKDKELKELQDIYNIAMKEIARLRRKLGYDKKIEELKEK